MLADVLPHWGVCHELEQAAVIFREPKLARGTEHAEGFDAAHLGPLDTHAGELSADQGAGDLHAGGDIGRAADYLQGSIQTRLAHVHPAELQLVGIGMFLRRQHEGHDDLGEGRRGGAHLLDLETGHGQKVRQFPAVQGRIDQAAQPVFGELHDYLNCERKRKSPS